MSYMDQSPVGCDELHNDHAGSWLRAAFIIGGGSALLWSLIIYAIWQLI